MPDTFQFTPLEVHQRLVDMGRRIERDTEQVLWRMDRDTLRLLRRCAVAAAHGRGLPVSCNTAEQLLIAYLARKVTHDEQQARIRVAEKAARHRNRGHHGKR